MHIAKLSQSRFLKKEDVGGGMDLTISHIVEDEVGTEDEPKRGFVMYWHEQEKPMVLNVTNAQMIAGVLGSEETDHWSGQPICLYNDPMVMYKGKRSGGIRIRPAGQHSAPHAQQVRPDPRQTPPPNTLQQAQQHAPQNQRPVAPRPPALTQPVHPAHLAPRQSAQRPPAHQAPVEDDVPWPTDDGQM